MQKIGKLVLAFVITLCCVSFICPKQDVSAKTTDKYNVKVGYGFSDKTRFGCNTPVKFSFTDVKEDFTGSIAVYVGAGESYRTDRDIVLGKGENKSITMSVIVSSLSEKIEYDILDSKGKVVSDGSLTISTTYDENFVYIGILSDDYQSLNYMNSALVDTNGEAVTKTVKLTKDDIPDEKSSLNMFNMIVVNNFNLDSLAKEQVAALERWVSDGGVLLVGTGANGKKAFDAFDKLSELVSLDSLETSMFNMAGRGECRVESYNVKSTNGTALIKDKDKSLITQYKYEVGKLYVAGFDLAQKEYAEYALKTKTTINSWGELVYSMLGEDGIYGKATNSDSNYYYISDQLNGNVNGELPKLWIYAIILIVYIGVLIPVIFVFLRKKDKSMYTFPTMAASAVVFSIIVYICGSSTRFSNPVLNYSRVVQKDSDRVEEKMYLGINVPNNKDYTIDISGEFDIIPMSEEYMGHIIREESASPRNYSMILKKATEGNEIKLVDLAAFESRLFELNRTNAAASEEIPKLEYDINIAKDKNIGKITNKSDKTVENAIVFISNVACEIGTIKPGESKDVIIDGWTSQSYNYVTDSLKDSDKTLTSSRKRTINNYCNAYCDPYMSGTGVSSNDAKIIYFLQGEDSITIQANEKYDCFGSTLYTESFDVKNEVDGNKIYTDTKKEIIGDMVQFAGENSVFFNDLLASSYEVKLKYNVTGFDQLSITNSNLVGNKDAFVEIGFAGKAYVCSADGKEVLDYGEISDVGNNYTDMSKYSKFVTTDANGQKYLIIKFVLDTTLNQRCHEGEAIALPKVIGKGKAK